MEQVTENQKSLSFADIFRILRGGIVWIVVITMLCVLVGGIYAFAFKETTYTAKLNAQIYVESYANNQSGDEEYVPEHTRFQYSALLAQKVNMLLLNNDVVDAVKSKDYGEVSLNGGKLSVTPEEEQPFFTVTYTYKQLGGDVKETQKQVAKTLNAYVNSAIEYIDDNSEKYPWFTVDSTIINNQNVPKSKIIIFSEAQADNVSASTGKATVIAISFIIGLVLSVIFVFIKNSFDDSITTKEDIERITGNQVIATIDISGGISTTSSIDNQVTEEGV